MSKNTAKANFIDDATLLKKAEAEILGEAKRAARRHLTAGIAGWAPCPRPNKLFLTNVLVQTISSNRLISHKNNKKRLQSKKSKRERKLLQKADNSDNKNFIFKKPMKNESSRCNSEKSSRKTLDSSSNLVNLKKKELKKKLFHKSVNVTK